MLTVLILMGIGYLVFRLITKQEAVLSKPSNPADRPRWLLKRWVFVSLVFVFPAPITGSAAMNIPTFLAIKLGILIISLLIGGLVYFVYKFAVRDAQPKEDTLEESSLSKKEESKAEDNYDEELKKALALANQNMRDSRR